MMDEDRGLHEQNLRVLPVLLEETIHGTFTIEESRLMEMKAAIEADVEDEMGFKKYAPLLKEMGFKLKVKKVKEVKSIG